MKQRKSKQVRLFSGMLIGIVMIAVLARIVYLNHCYPSPKVITYTDNDTIKLGNYETEYCKKRKYPLYTGEAGWICMECEKLYG